MGIKEEEIERRGQHAMKVLAAYHLKNYESKPPYKRLDAKSRALKNKKEGFDSHKRWGNSAVKGHGVNSPAMMEARKKLNK